MQLKYYWLCAMALFFCYFSGTQAGTLVGNTRLIFDGKQKETSISVNNPDKEPYLIQSWVDNPQGALDNIAFIVTPPLFRLAGNQENMLRVVRVGMRFPEDRESLYWLNVKSIPAKESADKSNTLQTAVKTRIKLIYRPPALLAQVPEDVTDRLQWRRTADGLSLTNPTPYYMDFHYVQVGDKKIKAIASIAPQSTEKFTLTDLSGSTVTWKLINDDGGTGEEHQIDI